MKIKDKDGKIFSFVWRSAQRKLHRLLERQKEITGKVRAIILKARQLGVSTYVGARFYHKTTLSPGLGQRSYIHTHEDPATQTLFDMVKFMHEQVPSDYHHRLIKSNANELRFAEIESGYRVGTAKNIHGTGRSQTIQNLHGSEMAFWPHAEKHLSGLVQAVPNRRGTEIIYESTANGVGGAFYAAWQNAIRGESEFIPIFLPWFEDRDYRLPVPDGFLPSTAESEYAELYDLDMEQLIWAHFENVDIGGTPGEFSPLFRQEYPATAEEAFQATGQNSYIKSELVMRARQRVLPDDSNAPLILGVDLATGGKDKTRMLSRRGRRLGHEINIEMDTDQPSVISDRIAVAIEEQGVDRVFVDLTGIGYGVVDNLRIAGYGDRVTGVNFGGVAAEEHKYANKRAEMYGRLNEWLKDPGGADVIDDDVFHEDVCAANFRYRMNKKGRQLLLEEKAKVKERLERQRSTDAGDSGVLTFAEKVYVPTPKKSSWADSYTGPKTRKDWLTT